MKLTAKTLRRLIREELEKTLSYPTVVSPGAQGDNAPSKWDEKVKRNVMNRLVSCLTLVDETIDMVPDRPKLTAQMSSVRKTVREALTDVNDDT